MNTFSNILLVIFGGCIALIVITGTLKLLLAAWS